MPEKSSTPENSLYRKAVFHHDQGDGGQAIKIAVPLSAQGYDPADFLLGLVYELGTRTSAIDIEKAIKHYRRAAIASRTATSHRYLARALMKSGHGGYNEAFRSLTYASNQSAAPENDLGLAWYFETKSEPDYPRSKSCYIRAAARGRFHGFFGYSRVARLEGNWIRALLVDCVRMLLGVPYFVLFGKKAQYGF